MLGGGAVLRVRAGAAVMHTQSRNPSRERDHRISLMPMDRDERPGALGALGIGFALSAPFWIAVIAWWLA